MKTILSSLAILAVAGPAFAGDTVRAIYRSESCAGTHERGSSIFKRSTGTPGAYFRSNLFRDAVILYNDTPEYMTFFVYSSDQAGPANLTSLVRKGAHVYDVIVPPYRIYHTDQRGRHYWVCSKPGKWGIDLAKGRIVGS
jgi:hypothetical protein